MSERRAIVVLLVLLSQAAMVHWAAGREQPPAAPDFANIPVEFAGWQRIREDPLAADVAAELGATRTLSCTYGHKIGGAAAGLFVAWFQSQRAGRSQPHSPKVCLPGSGWIPLATSTVRVSTTGGPIEINRYIVSQGKQRAIVLYWFQTPRRVIAGEWAAKFWLIRDALRDRRTDTALVRIIVFPSGGNDDAAIVEAGTFAQDVYPLLRKLLSR